MDLELAALCPQCHMHVAFTEVADHALAHQLEEPAHQQRDHSQQQGAVQLERTPSGKRRRREVVLERLWNGIEDPSIITDEYFDKQLLQLHTSGVISVLRQYYRDTRCDVYLSSATSHVASCRDDLGWGCCYRNIQMLFTSLLQLEPYCSLLAQKGVVSVPTIPRLQEMVEQAWQEGFDVVGCTQLNGRLKGTRKWIGTTEVVSLLRMHNIRAQVVDFAEATSSDGSHPMLLKWVSSYFRTGNATSTLTRRATPVANHGGQYPPLYWQHEGHSRTIIGIEEHALIVLDPSITSQELSRILSDPSHCIGHLHQRLTQLNHKQYELVFVEGVLSEAEKEMMKIITPYQRFP